MIHISHFIFDGYRRSISTTQNFYDSNVIPNNSTTLRSPRIGLNFDRIFTINVKMCGILLYNETLL